MDALNYINYVDTIKKLRPDCRFQNIKYSQRHLLFRDIKIFAWRTNVSFLRYSIENDELTELRIDLDEKDLRDNIKLMLDINNKCINNNMKVSWYYSGGKGIHGHLLVSLNNINDLLKVNNFNIDINKYDIEFKKIMENKKAGINIDYSKYPNYNYIQDRNKERALIKKAIMDYLGFKDKIDNMLYSSQEMITLEGTQKRNNGYFKIYLDLDQLKEVEKIYEYIGEMKYHPYLIDSNLFNNIYELNDNIKTHVTNYVLKNNLYLAKMKKKANNRKNCQEINHISRIGLKFEEINKNLKDYVITFANLFNKHSIDSKNVYAFMVIKQIWKLSKSFDITKCCFLKFLELTNYELTCSIDSKVRAGIENYKDKPVVYLCYKNYFNYNDFYYELNQVRTQE